MITTTTNDPYQSPFEWSDALELEAPEDRLFNLLPCGFQCEYDGWLPLLSGAMIACPSCDDSN